MRRISMFLFLIALVSCKSSHVDVERISLSPQILYEGLYTMLPGAMLLCENYLVWEDGFATDTFMHVIDLRTNQDIGIMGKIGRGPEELTTPDIIGSFNKNIVVTDGNLFKCAFYSIDSLLARKNPYIAQTDMNTRLFFSTVVDSTKLIALRFDTQKPFQLRTYNQEVLSEFGKFPIPDSITNRFEILQGPVLYNPQRHLLLYSANFFPYMAIYQEKSDNSYELIKETDYPIPYTIKENRARLLDENSDGFGVPAFTKDYIIFIKQDEDNPLPKQKPTSGIRDLSGVPHTVYIFDYDLNLLKIADLNMPVLRITANPENNTLYIIGLKDSYCIAKCEIE